MATVAQILQAKPVNTVHTIDANASVFDAIALMSKNEIGALIVMHASALCGIVTERDYARKVVLQDRSSRNTQVRDIMTAAVRHVRPDQTSDECMALMTELHIRHLPVIGADGRLRGLISIGDLVKSVIEEQQFAIDQLESYVRGSFADTPRPAVAARRMQAARLAMRAS
jgi:CBS domain-containing protein